MKKCCCEDLLITESEYQGKKVKLNDPIRTSENPNKKFKVYDLRNLYSAEEMKKNKIKYFSVGRPNIN